MKAIITVCKNSTGLESEDIYIDTDKLISKGAAMTDELKPCAHCGSEDTRVELTFFNEIKKVMCWGCGISTQFDPMAIEKWNRRV